MDDPRVVYIGTTDAARVLGITPVSAGRLVRSGRLPAVKITNRWLVARADVERLMRTYVPKPGRPRRKRKYTKRSPIWFEQGA